VDIAISCDKSPKTAGPTLRLRLQEITDYAIAAGGSVNGYTAELAMFLWELMNNMGSSYDTALGWSPERLQTVSNALVEPGDILTIVEMIARGDNKQVDEFNYSTEQHFGESFNFEVVTDVSLSHDMAREVVDLIAKAYPDAATGAASIPEAAPTQEPVAANGITFRDANGNVVLEQAHIVSVETFLEDDSDDEEDYQILFKLTEAGGKIMEGSPLIEGEAEATLYIDNMIVLVSPLTSAMSYNNLMFVNTYTKDEAEFLVRNITARLSQ
jgi:nitrogen regulatory protein PII